jgi:hypothetical protein
MTRVDEKEILEIEKLKQDIQLDMKRFDVEQEKLRLEIGKKDYEGWRLVFYGIAVGLGGTFAIAKTISLMGW